MPAEFESMPNHSQSRCRQHLRGGSQNGGNCSRSGRRRSRPRRTGQSFRHGLRCGRSWFGFPHGWERRWNRRRFDHRGWRRRFGWPRFWNWRRGRFRLGRLRHDRFWRGRFWHGRFWRGWFWHGRERLRRWGLGGRVQWRRFNRLKHHFDGRFRGRDEWRRLGHPDGYSCDRGHMEHRRCGGEARAGRFRPAAAVSRPGVCHEEICRREVLRSGLN